MSKWLAVALSSESWAPANYLPARAVQAAPPAYDGPFFRLAELVDFLPALRAHKPGEAVVTPAGVSRQSGAVQPGERAPSGTVFRLGHNVQPGDVLVPLGGNGPCVLLIEEHRSIAFSQGFAALRPKDGVRGSLIWALLSSTSGVNARNRVHTGSVVPRISASTLGELMVPEPARLGSIDHLLPSPPVDEMAPAAVVSRWRLVGLSQTLNWEPRRLLDPAESTAGLPLTELGDVRQGRLDPRTYVAHPFPRAQPALRSAEVGTLSTPRWWAAAEERDIAGEGSILVGAFSLRVASPTKPVAVARDILVIDVKPWRDLSAEEVRDRLLAYLASAAGQRRLAAYTTGAAIRRLSKTSLLALRVPSPEQLPNARPAETDLLATRLEEALWS